MIRRRHVIYISGYDPRGVAEYYRMFRSEYRNACKLHELTGKSDRASAQPDRCLTTWTVSTQGDGWNNNATYQVLHWDDIVRHDFDRAIWWKIAYGVYVFSRIVWDGTLAAFAHAHWRFALFVTYPYAMLALNLLIACGAGLLAEQWMANQLSSPLDLVAGLAVATTVFIALMRQFESRSSVLYLLDDISSHYQFANGLRPDWHERFDRFADHLVATAKTSDADEILVIGHSSGSFVAVDVMARALERDPALGRHGPRISLLTIGANLPTIGFQKKAGWFRARLKRLAQERGIFWADYQARKDVMNFYPFDPVTGHGVDMGDERINPTVKAVRFRDLMLPENYGALRWRFFQMHFQFLRANQLRGAAYDYLMMCCGPVDLETRATRPDQAVAATASTGADTYGSATLSAA